MHLLHRRIVDLHQVFSGITSRFGAVGKACYTWRMQQTSGQTDSSFRGRGSRSSSRPTRNDYKDLPRRSAVMELPEGGPDTQNPRFVTLDETDPSGAIPQLDTGTGDIDWRRNGILTRDNGPAVISADGSEVWYQQGLMHRDGGQPAVTVVAKEGLNQEWYWRGKKHREDGPAVVYPDGRMEWYQHGQLHRLDGPAIMDSDGNQLWWLNGQLHREGAPAIERTDGSQEWYLHGKRHREDGPAVTNKDGSQEWHQHGQWHREDGPAIIHTDGYQEWLSHDKLHREDGPAVRHADGSQEWWRRGELVANTEEEYEHFLQGQAFRAQIRDGATSTQPLATALAPRQRPEHHHE